MVFPWFTLTRGHLVSVSAIALLTGVNIFGLRRGAVLQNAATWMKFAAIAAFVTLGILLGHGDWSHFTKPAQAAPGSLLSAYGVALIAVFWAYDGWVYVTWVAGEIKQPQRTLPRAMFLGVAAVAVIYVTVNVVYLYALPMDAMARELTIAQAAAVTLFSPGGARWLAATIAVSCFGAMSCGVMSGSRVYYAMARDGLFFNKLAEVHPRWHTPVFSLIVQGIWSSVLAVSGRYDQLYTYAVFGLVLSYVAGAAGLFVLRRKLPDHPRPYRCTGYPYLPAIYVVLGTAWAVNTVWQRPREALAGIVLILLGVPGYLYWRRGVRHHVS
jgi:APA family basic amino acid/polyamine antiporter